MLLSRLRLFALDARRSAIIASIFAVLAGGIYMSLAKAPNHMVAVNAAALAVAVLVIKFLVVKTENLLPFFCIVSAALLLTTACAGTSLGGVYRWFQIGPLQVQPAMLLLAAAVTAFICRPTNLSTIAMILISISLALQPDRAMAGAMTLSLMTIAILMKKQSLVLAAAMSLAAFAVTLWRPDNLPAVEFVEAVYRSSFLFNPAIGVLISIASLALFWPMVMAALNASKSEVRMAAIGNIMIWAGVMVAAIFGNYPTPLVGYGASAIVGYALSIAIVSRAENRWGKST